jgi:hypothetical protein
LLSTGLLALALTTPVKATCFRDRFGNVQYCGLSILARAILAISVFFIAAAILALLLLRQRRRARRANLTYVTNPNINTGYIGAPGAVSQPQYPPQTYWNGAPAGGSSGDYNPQSGFAPVSIEISPPTVHQESNVFEGIDRYALQSNKAGYNS